MKSCIFLLLHFCVFKWLNARWQALFISVPLSTRHSVHRSMRSGVFQNTQFRVPIFFPSILFWLIFILCLIYRVFVIAAFHRFLFSLSPSSSYAAVVRDLNTRIIIIRPFSECSGERAGGSTRARAIEKWECEYSEHDRDGGGGDARVNNTRAFRIKHMLVMFGSSFVQLT